MKNNLILTIAASTLLFTLFSCEESTELPQCETDNTALLVVENTGNHGTLEIYVDRPIIRSSGADYLIDPGKQMNITLSAGLHEINVFGINGFEDSYELTLSACDDFNLPI
ncbi:hypothetical protein [Ekhidna sp.]|uniref:hypothetical protein n=1 Tax=Ekhidna sp. TaxID=2608089 RepID=UPI003B504554